MTPYNDIFVLHQTGLNHSQIERKLGTVTRKTIISVLQLAEKYSFRYNPEDGLSDTDIHRILHPKKNKKDRMPNLDVCFYRLGLPDQSIAGLRSLYAEECARRGVTPYSRSMFQNIIAEERHKDIISDLKLRFPFHLERNHTPVHNIGAVTLGRIFQTDICQTA